MGQTSWRFPLPAGITNLRNITVFVVSRSWDKWLLYTCLWVHRSLWYIAYVEKLYNYNSGRLHRLCIYSNQLRYGIMQKVETLKFLSVHLKFNCNCTNKSGYNKPPLFGTYELSIPISLRKLCFRSFRVAEKFQVSINSKDA